MLHQPVTADELDGNEAVAFGGPAAASPAAEPWQRSAYQPGTGGRSASAFGAGLVVGGMLVALFALGGHHHHHRHHPHRMVVMDLPIEPPPPPPAPRQVTKAPEVKPAPQVFAPPPIVPTPVAAPSPVAVSPVPVPPPPVLVAAAAPSAPPAPPAPAPSPADMGDLSSRMISATPPSYPLESRRRREQGTVVLAVLLGTDGRVSDIAVSSSSGFDRLDHAALSAVRRWRWAPIVRDGVPALVRGLVRIPFVLKS